MILEKNKIPPETGNVVNTLLSSAKYKLFNKPNVQDIIEKANIITKKTIITSIISE